MLTELSPFALWSLEAKDVLPGGRIPSKLLTVPAMQLSKDFCEDPEEISELFFRRDNFECTTRPSRVYQLVDSHSRWNITQRAIRKTFSLGYLNLVPSQDSHLMLRLPREYFISYTQQGARLQCFPPFWFFTPSSSCCKMWFCEQLRFGKWGTTSFQVRSLFCLRTCESGHDFNN